MMNSRCCFRNLIIKIYGETETWEIINYKMLDKSFQFSSVILDMKIRRTLFVCFPPATTFLSAPQAVFDPTLTPIVFMLKKAMSKQYFLWLQIKLKVKWKTRSYRGMWKEKGKRSHLKMSFVFKFQHRKGISKQNKKKNLIFILKYHTLCFSETLFSGS